MPSDGIFIIGCARSGTTAWARVIDTAINAEVHVEQPPKLRVASRELLEDNLENPVKTLEAAKLSAIRDANSRGLIYGDKNPCYMPFIPYLEELGDVRILFLTRDGREVVRSLVDWHNHHAGNIYASPEDSPDADEANGRDYWDYSRPRPGPGDPAHEAWTGMSRFEKCAWYWDFFNREAMKRLEGLASSRWCHVNVSAAGVEEAAALFEQFSLDGFSAERVDELLSARINSLKNRKGKDDVAPRWPDWSPDRIERFEELAGDTMQRLGYA